jgi:hypothetical protein
MRAVLASVLAGCAVPGGPVVLPHITQYEGTCDSGVGRLELADDGTLRFALHFAFLDIQWEARGVWCAEAGNRLDLVVFDSRGHPRLFAQSIADGMCVDAHSWVAVRPDTHVSVLVEDDVAVLSGPCIPFRLPRTR